MTMQSKPEEVVRNYRKRFTAYINELRNNSDEKMLEEFAKLRAIDVQAVKDAGIFFIGDPAEMLLPEYIDEVRDFGVIAINNKPIYTGRYVFPILDEEGLVKGLVGYKPGLMEKYMYATPKYFNRGDAIYGLENMQDVLDSGVAVVAEGLMDRLRIKSLGFKNSLATCGADKSWERMLIFNGIKKCVFIPDRDRAGVLTNKHWKSETSLRILTPRPFKDIDEFARQNERTSEFCKEVIERAIEYIQFEMTPGSNKEIDIEKELQV